MYYHEITIYFKPVYVLLNQELATLFYHPLRMNPEYIMSHNDDEIDYDKQFDKPVIHVLKKQRVL